MNTTKQEILKVPSESFYGTGKRKCAIAKVWLFNGNGTIQVNKMDFVNYFGNDLIANSILKPLTLLALNKKISVKISVLGGGKASQIDACILGISRGFNFYEP